ncbi:MULTISPECIES: hypothetical protein [Pseudomonas]|uniref:hypothetical protein n=1 Tax=Pseudomonas TaxID=286 RepID=UPI001C3CB47B|nr:hypothetical protein [Pseudomonas azerbaijanorientalis]QXH64347.1 hypothetical protein KSS91_13085 [Pseudomonas azerbaijanorientalis]
MNSNIERVGFPPKPDVGSRVWSGSGYLEHGPIEGPKVDIASKIGGVITNASKPYSTYDDKLCVVQWDDGTNSKHYSNDLVCIGRFQSFQEFESATQIHGPIQVTAGPQGGFQEAKFSVTYDGQVIDAHLLKSDQKFWTQCIQPLARTQKIAIKEKRVQAKKRS